MKVTILFNAHATPSVARRDGFRTRPRRIDASVEVEVREVTTTQAPVAIHCHAGDDSPEFDYRWFEGELWTSMRLVESKPRASTPKADEWNYPPLPAEIDLRGKGTTLSNPLHELSVEVGDEGTMGEALRQWASKTLLIAGEVYRPAFEPRYVVKIYGHGGGASRTTLALTSYTASQPELCFGLNELDAAIALAEKIAAERGDTTSLPIRSAAPKIRVLIPEAIKIKNQPFPEEVWPRTVDELLALAVCLDARSGGLIAEDGRRVRLTHWDATRFVADLARLLASRPRLDGSPSKLEDA